MQVGEENLVLPQKVVLAGFRLLHLHDHFRLGINFGSGIQHDSARIAVVFIAEAAAFASVGFHVHGVAFGNIGRYVIGGQTNAVFMIFQFFGSSDDHGGSLLQNG